MSKIIYLVRHGESEMNAGKICKDCHSPGLTEKGKTQAEEFVKHNIKSDIIICSSYIRTQQTAAPFIKEQPEAEVYIWDLVREFMILSAKLGTNITKEDADKYCHNFFYESFYNPRYRDRGQYDCENLIDLKNRAVKTFMKLDNDIADNKTIVIFTHALFINMMELIYNRIKGKYSNLYGINFDMNFYQQFHGMNEINNCAYIKLILN